MKFELKENERLFIEGHVAYLKSKVNVVQGDAYLTSERFVYCKKSPILSFLLLGPLFGLFVKGKDLVFEIPLCELKSIHEEKHGLGKKIIFTTNSGNEYAIAFGTRKEKWLKAIKEAVTNSVPNITVSEIGERIDFTVS